jgi:hypothetical protein
VRGDRGDKNSVQSEFVSPVLDPIRKLGTNTAKISKNYGPFNEPK